MVKLENKLKQKKIKIGILGGSFDPAHKGHVAISKEAHKKFIGDLNNEIAIHGGREYGMKQLKHALQHLNKYNETRDIMSEETSMLSAYIKYGCISIR